MREAISNNLVGDLSNMQVELLMVGKFKGPGEEDKRYGSPTGQRDVRIMFSIMRIEEAKPLKSNAFPPETLPNDSFNPTA